MMTFLIEAIFTSGSVLYIVIFGLVNGLKKVWNPTLNAGAGGWETYNSSNWSQYAVAMVEDTGSGHFSVAYPAGISGVLTTEVAYIRGGGSPTLGDSPINSNRSQGNNVAAVGGSVQAALNMGASTGSMQTGALFGAQTSSLLATDLASSTDDQFIGRIVVLTSGAANKQVQYITAYNGTTKALTLAAPLTTAPSAADTFVII